MVGGAVCGAVVGFRHYFPRPVQLVADPEFWNGGGGRTGAVPPPQDFLKFYAEIMHFCANFLLGYKMRHAHNWGGRS